MIKVHTWVLGATTFASRAGTLLEFPRGDRQAQRRQERRIKQSSLTLHPHAMIRSHPVSRCEDSVCRGQSFNQMSMKVSIPRESSSPSGASGEEPVAQCRRRKRCWFNPWVRKIPWRRAWHPHSSILAWRIPGTEKPGGLQSIQFQRVRHDWINNTHRFEENTEKKDNMRLASSTLQAFDKI